jgi:hypothetical protein
MYGPPSHEIPPFGRNDAAFAILGKKSEATKRFPPAGCGLSQACA